MTRTARSSIDVGRLAQGVKRPGIDPRVHTVTGTVKEIGIDPKEGVFADVAFEPEGNVETCYVAVPCAGSTNGEGWGDWYGLEVGDTVAVMISNGDTNTGPIVVGRYWNAGDPPPSEIVDGDEPTKDRWSILKPGTKWVIKCDEVLIGDEQAAFLAHAKETQDALKQIITALQAFYTAVSTANTANPALPIVSGTLFGYLAKMPDALAAATQDLATLPTTKVKGT